MTDYAIDLDEILDYTPRAVAAIQALALGRLAAFDPALAELCERLTARAAAVQSARHAARAAETDLRLGVRAKSPAFEAARDALVRFGWHLDAHPRGSVDRRLFFAKDGTRAGIGNATLPVLHAIETMAHELGKPGCPVRDAAFWRAELLARHAALGGPAAAVARARAARREVTPALRRARAEWTDVYRAARDVVAGLLRLTGGLALLPSIFPDLAARTRRRGAKPAAAEADEDKSSAPAESKV